MTGGSGLEDTVDLDKIVVEQRQKSAFFNEPQTDTKDQQEEGKVGRCSDMDCSSLHSFNFSNGSMIGSEGRTMSEIEQLPPTSVILKNFHEFSPTEKILARMESENTSSHQSSTYQGYPISSMSSTINKDSTLHKGAKYNSPFIHPTNEPARVVNPPRLTLKLQTEGTDGSSSVVEDIMSSEVESSIRQPEIRSNLRDKYFRSSIGFTSSSGSYSTFK